MPHLTKVSPKRITLFSHTWSLKQTAFLTRYFRETTSGVLFCFFFPVAFLHGSINSEARSRPNTYHLVWGNEMNPAVRWASKNVRWGKWWRKFWKNKTFPAAPHPHPHCLTSPSLQQEAMMASAESGRGAILSTHKHGQQLRELVTLCNGTKNQPWLHARVSTYRHCFWVRPQRRRLC